MLPAVAAPPTADALHAAASASYEAAKDLGIHYSSPHVAAMAGDVQNGLNLDGSLAPVAPQTHAFLDQLQAIPQGNSTVPFVSLETARRVFGKISQNPGNSTDARAASIAEGAIDQFYSNPPPGAVVAGPGADATRILADARGNAAAGFRSDTLNGIEYAAGQRAAAADSGQNAGNAIRSRIASLLIKGGGTNGFTPGEVAALEGVNNGSASANFTRFPGNMLGGGGGASATHAALTGGLAGYELGGGTGAALGATTPLVGLAAKAVSNNLTKNALTAADEMVRSRSPLFDQLQAAAQPTQGISPLSGAFLGRAAVAPGIAASLSNAPAGSRQKALADVFDTRGNPAKASDFF